MRACGSGASYAVPDDLVLLEEVLHVGGSLVLGVVRERVEELDVLGRVRVGLLMEARLTVGRARWDLVGDSLLGRGAGVGAVRHPDRGAVGPGEVRRTVHLGLVPSLFMKRNQCCVGEAGTGLGQGCGCVR